MTNTLSHVTKLTLPSSTMKESILSSANLPTSNMVTAWFFRPCGGGGGGWEGGREGREGGEGGREEER